MFNLTFNEQKLLFGESEFIRHSTEKNIVLPENFYSNGYTLIDGITSPQKAYESLETFIASIALHRLPLFSHFASTLQLAKADLIPVCDDVVESSFQVLHLDMGQPIISKKPQTMYLITGLYAPIDKQGGTAKTRIVSLKGLFADPKWGTSQDIERKLIRYVTKYGDGWGDVNTKRLSCFARVLDSVSGTTDVATFRDKTVGQWFQNEKRLDAQESMRNEYHFYKEKGIDLISLERHIQLQPGQVLIFDNTRVVHGRVGKRDAKEVYQFLFGIKNATQKDIQRFRKHFVAELTTK